MVAIACKEQAMAMEKVLAGHEFYDQDDYDKAIDTINTLVGMLSGYGEIYQDERKDWMLPPQNIETRFHVDCGDFDFEGSIDAIPQINKRWAVVEHKSAAKIHDTYVLRLPQDTQVRGYIFGAKFGLNIPISRVVYDVVKKCKLKVKGGETHKQFGERIALDYMSRPDFYFMRENLLFSSKDLAMFERDLFKTHEEFMWLTTNYVDPLNPDTWVANDGACYEYFRNCDYLSLCTGGLGLDNTALYRSHKDLHMELAEDTDE